MTTRCRAVRRAAGSLGWFELPRLSGSLREPGLQIAFERGSHRRLCSFAAGFELLRGRFVNMRVFLRPDSEYDRSRTPIRMQTRRQAKMKRICDMTALVAVALGTS